MSQTEVRPEVSPEAPKGNWFKEHKVMTGILVVIVLAIISSLTGGGESAPTSAQRPSEQIDTGPVPDAASTESSAASDATASSTAMNQPARDGKFEFVVKSLECGATSVGNQYLNKKAQGHFCMLSVSVKNIGKEPQHLFGSNQYLFDAEGRKFSADTEAAIYMDDSKSIWEEINPGNQIDGVIVFDLPTGVQPVKAQLHDSAFSGGVTVALH